MPTCDGGDLLVTDWTQTALLFPQAEKPLVPFEGTYHFHVETFFIVAFPLRVIRVGLSSDFDVSFDWHMCGVCEIVRLLLGGSVEHPMVSFAGGEVVLRCPCMSFSWVSSSHPLSHHLIDRVVYGGEGVFAHHVLVIERPTPNERVQLPDQFSGTESAVSFHDIPYLFEEGVNILL